MWPEMAGDREMRHAAERNAPNTMAVVISTERSQEVPDLLITVLILKGTACENFEGAWAMLAFLSTAQMKVARYLPPPSLVLMLKLRPHQNC